MFKQKKSSGSKELIISYEKKVPWIWPVHKTFSTHIRNKEDIVWGSNLGLLLRDIVDLHVWLIPKLASEVPKLLGVSIHFDKNIGIHIWLNDVGHWLYDRKKSTVRIDYSGFLSFSQEKFHTAHASEVFYHALENVLLIVLVPECFKQRYTWDQHTSSETKSMAWTWVFLHWTYSWSSKKSIFVSLLSWLKYFIQSYPQILL